jgi:hypothetical protein
VLRVNDSQQNILWQFVEFDLEDKLTTIIDILETYVSQFDRVLNQAEMSLGKELCSSGNTNRREIQHSRECKWISVPDNAKMPGNQSDRVLNQARM